MRLTAMASIIAGNGSHRSEPAEVVVNPAYITHAWPAGGSGGAVYLLGCEGALRVDTDSMSKVERWIDEEAAMSFGEGNLRERVAELERENARLQAQLAEGGQMYRRALGRGRELESLARDMGAYIDGIVNECHTINMAYGNDLLDRMADLGIGEEGGGA